MFAFRLRRHSNLGVDGEISCISCCEADMKRREKMEVDVVFVALVCIR